MQRILAILFAVGCGCITISCVGAQHADAISDSIAARSLEFFRSSRATGLAVGVVRDGKTVYTAGFGVTSTGGTSPVTPRTVFHMASISKTFVATAVMQLVEQKMLRLDDPVVKHVPYFALRDSRFARITVRQLLNHTAGLPDVSDYGWDKPEYDDNALERWIRGLKDSTLISEPGAEWEYSNVGFELLAHIVAAVSGESFEDYVQRHILSPLDMAHSTFLMTDIDSANLASGHEMVRGNQVQQAYPYNRRHAGSSTMHSDVEDMLRYGVFQANRGRIGTRQILGPQSYDLLWKKERDLSALFAREIALSRATVSRPLTSVAMGLGWFLLDFSGDRVVNHNGGDVGFRSSLFIAPEKRTVVVVFANSSADVDELAGSLMHLALGAQPVPPPPTVVLTAVELARYAGVYLLKDGMSSVELTFVERDGRLVAQPQGQPAQQLNALGNDTFGADFDPTLRVRFTMRNGKATSLTLTQSGQSVECPRVTVSH